MTRVYLASPVEPSGASWLVNCFLELGIKVSHKPVVDNVWRQSDPLPPPDQMWRRAPDGSHRLHPKARVLKKWLPALTRIESFAFRDDIEVEYVQDLPAAPQFGQPVLFFVRDPRDSLYSMYLRMRPALSYEAFLRFPDPDTLYDRPTHWRLFVESWLALAGDNWFAFESYKQDAAALLHRVLERMRLTCGAEDIERAVLESSFDKARAAEELYRTRFPGDWEVANRSGRPGDWLEQTEARTGSILIESRAGDLMQRLGYECLAETRVPPPDRVCLPLSDAARLTGDRLDDPLIDEALASSRDWDETVLRRTNLPSHRIRRLLDNLAHVAGARGHGTVDSLSRLRERFDEGSEHQFAQMRDLLIRRRRAREHGE